MKKIYVYIYIYIWYRQLDQLSPTVPCTFLKNLDTLKTPTSSRIKRVLSKSSGSTRFHTHPAVYSKSLKTREQWDSWKWIFLKSQWWISVIFSSLVLSHNLGTNKKSELHHFCLWKILKPKPKIRTETTQKAFQGFQKGAKIVAWNAPWATDSYNHNSHKGLAVILRTNTPYLDVPGS